MKETVQDQFKALLAEFTPDPNSSLEVTIQKALFVARRLQERAGELQTPPEKRQQAELDRMLQTPQDKATLTQMTDQAFRSNTPHRAVDQFIHILDVQGVPRFFNPIQRTLLKGFQSFGGYAPGVAVPLVKEHMRKETANVILPAEPEVLLRHLRERHAEGVRMNVNYLGEAILGEEEAYRRLQVNLEGLQASEVECISIKISTINSQINPLAREHTVSALCERLELLYRTATHLTFTRPDGRQVPKFVYLDMEEYRDMDITAEAFMRTLDGKGLEQVEAGIVLQSYIPDSYQTQLRINEWARGRVASGGAPITLRLVKGANMEMERVEASQRGWPAACYQIKSETDANFKRMVQEGMKPDNITAVHLGIASHNLFDLAYALVLAEETNHMGRVQFEMLEGMANSQRRALFELSRNLLLYSPVCHKQDFIYAIGYLIRRLDENTGPDNFLRHAFRIKPDCPEWQHLEQGFVDSFTALSTLSNAPRRTQDRRQPAEAIPAVEKGWAHFINEPDTDFTLPANIEWAEQILTDWKDQQGVNAPNIPLVIQGEDILQDRRIRDCQDPSRPGVVVGRYCQASDSDVQTAVACAVADKDGWRSLSPEARFDILGRVAQEIRLARGDLMGAALAEGGKILPESDPEVSEAVDFLEFYRDTAREWQEMSTLKAEAKGVVAVVPPWNFPIAIPCGGVAAALAASNTVILKPASDTVLVAWILCQCFWRAGISKNTLQFLPCSGAVEGRKLVAHPDVSAVILTGGTETALTMLQDKPSMNLSAETGGKNATIVTAMADRDLAIKHVLHSAFSHGGQKCSATSLLLLEAEIYDDPKFKQSLCDAVHSLEVGSAWDLKSKMGPLIRPPSGDLENALKVLEPGESWAVLPRRLANNPNLWSPGIKYGVKPGSYTHMTEFFGPVLGVMRFKKLAEAIDLVNQTGYGLTSGLESLDDREQEQWREGIHAGNLYINRTTVGAIVLRQPFGGMGKSAFGPGIKAGGPNYVAQFMTFADTNPPEGDDQPEDPLLSQLGHDLSDPHRFGDALPTETLQSIRTALGSYSKACREEFSQCHDHFKLVGQDNLRRYLRIRHLRVRLHPEDSLFDVLARVSAAKTAGCHTTISHAPDCHEQTVKILESLTEHWAGAIEFVEETDEQLAEVIREHQTDRIRYAAAERVPLLLQETAGQTGLCIVSHPVVAEGRLELLWYLEEQSVSFDYHRYGNLGTRVAEVRAEVF